MYIFSFHFFNHFHGVSLACLHFSTPIILWFSLYLSLSPFIMLSKPLILKKIKALIQDPNKSSRNLPSLSRYLSILSFCGTWSIPRGFHAPRSCMILGQLINRHYRWSKNFVNNSCWILWVILDLKIKMILNFLNSKILGVYTHLNYTHKQILDPRNCGYLICLTFSSITLSLLWSFSQDLAFQFNSISSLLKIKSIPWRLNVDKSNFIQHLFW